ncbi:hypothetical protein BVY03_01920 [bacterium K02(2017)]|nr:hypothetical protein BVY03_01920 [bacterium K02(2017)]
MKLPFYRFFSGIRPSLFNNRDEASTPSSAVNQTTSAQPESPTSFKTTAFNWIGETLRKPRSVRDIFSHPIFPSRLAATHQADPQQTNLKTAVQVFASDTSPSQFYYFNDNRIEFRSSPPQPIDKSKSPSQNTNGQVQFLNLRPLYHDGALKIRKTKRFWEILHVQDDHEPKLQESFKFKIDDGRLYTLIPNQVIRIPIQNRLSLISNHTTLELDEYSQNQINENFRSQEEFNAKKRDHKTGLPNEYAWEIEIERLKKSDKPFTVVSFDIDGLKAANDHIAPPGFDNAGGHERGDLLIKSVCHMLQSKVRQDEVIVYRLHAGGDELMALIKGKTAQESMPIIRRMMLSIEDPNSCITFQYKGTTDQVIWEQIIRPTLTAGVIDSMQEPNPEKILTAADGVLMAAKSKGLRGSTIYNGKAVFPNFRAPYAQTYFEQDRALLDFLRVFKQSLQEEFAHDLSEDKVKEISESIEKLTAAEKSIYKTGNVIDGLIIFLEQIKNYYELILKNTDIQISSDKITDFRTKLKEIDLALKDLTDKDPAKITPLRAFNILAAIENGNLNIE